MKRFLSLIISLLMLSGLVFFSYADTPADAYFLFKGDLIYMTVDFASYINETMFTRRNNDARFVFNNVSLPGFESEFTTGQQIIIGEKQYTVVIPGDVIKNGKVSLADARMALRIAAKLESADNLSMCAADINMDGAITPADARIILRQAARLCEPITLNVDRNMTYYSIISCEAVPDMLENGKLTETAVLDEIADTYTVSKKPIASGNYEVFIIVKESLRTAEGCAKIETDLKNSGFIFGDISFF